MKTKQNVFPKQGEENLRSNCVCLGHYVMEFFLFERKEKNKCFFSIVQNKKMASLVHLIITLNMCDTCQMKKNQYDTL